ncbi:hypothetical protein [Helicobacter sp. 10-6591]|uniref:hypothetical protein n=1 Tax=Helicobacter sp. 10-6591 TaxID=2004998 RepID=UPI000DCF0AAC|nr:hypothetical protein [Helicobacter sp. 10-6591]RAX56364.1 hypothetical protein CCY97_00740 [Helicobacter sp. 10-6591]
MQQECITETAQHYRVTITTMLTSMNKEVKHIIADDLSDHLTNRQIKRNSSRVQDLLNMDRR